MVNKKSAIDDSNKKVQVCRSCNSGRPEPAKEGVDALPLQEDTQFLSDTKDSCSRQEQDGPCLARWFRPELERSLMLAPFETQDFRSLIWLVCMYVCMYVYLYVCMYVCISVCICVGMYVCIYVLEYTILI